MQEKMGLNETVDGRLSGRSLRQGPLPGPDKYDFGTALAIKAAYPKGLPRLVPQLMFINVAPCRKGRIQPDI